MFYWCFCGLNTLATCVFLKEIWLCEEYSIIEGGENSIFNYMSGGRPVTSWSWWTWDKFGAAFHWGRWRVKEVLLVKGALLKEAEGNFPSLNSQHEIMELKLISFSRRVPEAWCGLCWFGKDLSLQVGRGWLCCVLAGGSVELFPCRYLPHGAMACLGYPAGYLESI